MTNPNESAGQPHEPRQPGRIPPPPPPRVHTPPPAAEPQGPGQPGAPGQPSGQGQPGQPTQQPTRHPTQQLNQPVSTDNGFKPENVTSTARAGIRAVIAIAAVVAVLIPLSIGGAMFAQALQTRYHKDTAAIDADLTDLHVDVPMGYVTVESAAVDEPRVTAVYTGPLDPPTITVKKDPKASASSVSVQMPAGARIGASGELRVDVQVPEAQAKGVNVTAESEFSEIDLNGQFAAVKAKSRVGAINTSALRTSHLEATTDLGAIDLDGSFGSVVATTGVGEIAGDDLKVTEHLQATSAVGSIELSFGTDAAPKEGMTLVSKSGEVELGLPHLNTVRNAGAEGYRIDAAGAPGVTTVSVDSLPADSGKPVIPVQARSNTGGVNVFYTDEPDGTASNGS